MEMLKGFFCETVWVSNEYKDKEFKTLSDYDKFVEEMKKANEDAGKGGDDGN